MVGIECDSSADKSLWAALAPHPKTQALLRVPRSITGGGRRPHAARPRLQSARSGTSSQPKLSTLQTLRWAVRPLRSSGPLEGARPRGSAMSSRSPPALRRCQPVKNLHVSSADDASLRDLWEHRELSATATATWLLESREVDLLVGRRRFLGCEVLKPRPLLDPDSLRRFLSSSLWLSAVF